MTSWNEMLERNRTYSENKHKPAPYLSEAPGPLPSTFIYSCIDFRVPVEDFLGVKTEEAFIVRNAGGRIQSNIKDLIFIETFTQEQVVKNVIVIHHTDCGFTHNTDEGVKEKMKVKAPQLAEQIDGLHFGTFGSSEKLEESVREDLEFLKSQPLLRQDLKDSAKGYIYDIKTGKLNPVS